MLATMHGVAPNALFLTLWGEGQRDGRGIPINAPECTFRHYAGSTRRKHSLQVKVEQL